MTAIKDSVIWITGASSGIGEAIAQACSAAGASIIISARRAEELARVQATCAHQEKVYILPLDLSKQENMPDKVAEAIAAFGHVDILINNGGISQRSLIKETLASVDRQIMEINYFGTIALTKALLPHFIERKSGHVATITSLVGKFGTPLRSAYSASKHALHGFFDAYRAEHYADGLKVTMICPGFIKTNVSVNALTAKGEKQNTMDQAQANGMSPETCAKHILSAIAKNKEEVYIGGKEIMGVYLKRWVPTLFSKILRKMKVT